MVITILLGVAMVLVPKTHAIPAAIRLYPDSPMVLGDATGTNVVGQEFSIAAVVENVTNAFGGDVIIAWNTTYFDYVSHNLTMPWNGTTLSDTGPSPYLGFLYSAGFTVDNTVDTVAGTYSAAYACVAGTNTFSGNGTFCSVKLKVKKQPASYEVPLGNYITIAMDIAYAKIVDKNANEITPPITDGEVHLYSRLWQYPPVPMLKVMPSSIDGSGIGTTHVVQVWLMGADGNDLDPFWDPGGFEIQMNFNTTLLEALDVTIDPDGWFAGPTSSFWEILLEVEETIDNTAGTVVVVFTGYGDNHNATEGKGVLLTVTFNEIYASTKLPAPYASITLQVPKLHEEWFHVHADAGLIPRDAPVGTDWHGVDVGFKFWTPFHINDWMDMDGDGLLSEGDELNMTDGNTGKWRDYTLEVLTGTLNVTQEELNVTDTILACPTPENLSLSMPNFGINYAYVYMGNGTERYLDPAEYIGHADAIEILGSLDSYVCDTFIVGVNVTLDSYNGFSSYVGMGGVDYITAYNGTHTWNLTDEVHYWWWNCDDWWYLDPIPDLARGDMLKAYYYASSILEVNYKTIEDDPDRYVEFVGDESAMDDFDEWLLEVADPVCSNYSEIWPDSVRSPYHVIGWLDNGDGLLTAGDKLIMEYTRTGGIGRYNVTNIATDMVIDRIFCICDREVDHEFYGDRIKAWIAGVGHPERDMCPWHGQDYIVHLPHVVEDGRYCAAVITPVGVDLYICDYPAPFGGQGPMKPSDMFQPQKEVCLCAYASYNFWPEQNKDVAFKVIDPHGETFTVLYGRTNEVGIAEVCFRLPWMCDDPEYYFGEWTVIAEVDIACVCYNDTLWFKHDYLVNTWKVTTEREEYAHCEDIAITVEYGSYAMQEFEITYTVTILDDSGVPFGYVEVTFTIGGAEYCRYENGSFTVYLHVVKWARAGMATVHVGALDSRGNPITQLNTTTVYILPRWA